MTKRPVEGKDFNTYGAANQGWHWYCLRCMADEGRGGRWSRVDARSDARKHVEASHVQSADKES